MEVKLKNVRLSHGQLFKPTEFISNGKADGKPKFRAVFLMEPNSENIKAIKEAMVAEAKNLWGAKGIDVLKSISGNPQKCSFQNGNIKPDKDGYPGNFYLGTSNKVKPRVVDRDGKTVLEESSGRPYDGCYVNAIVDIFASKNTGNGVFASLKGVMFVKDGDAFGGGAPLTDDAFEDLAEQGQTETTGSTDDFGV